MPSSGPEFGGDTNSVMDRAPPVSDVVGLVRYRTPSHSMASVPGGDVPIDPFCDLGHVVFSPVGNSKAMGDAALARVGRKRPVIMTMPSFSGVYRAVAGSDLIALSRSALADHVAPSAGLDVYRAPMPVPTAQIAMVCHRRCSSSPPHLWLRLKRAEGIGPLDDTALRSH